MAAELSGGGRTAYTDGPGFYIFNAVDNRKSLMNPSGRIQTFFICILLCIATGCAAQPSLEDEIHEADVSHLGTQRIVITPTPRPTVTASPTVTAALSTSDEAAKGIIADTADEVIRALRDKDMETLAQFVDPINGVEFSPYIASGGVRFQADQVAGLFQDKTKYLWGYADGSGDPIELTFATYYEGFIYDLDYAHPTRITFNAAGLGYFEDEFLPAPSEDRILVEYVVEQEGLYAQGLILIFEKDQEGAWYLVRVIHDTWLI